MKNLIKKYPLLFVVLFTLIVFTAILVISAINIKTTAEIELLVAPASAKVTIDGKPYDNGIFRIELGEHQVHIEKEGFISQDITFNTLNTTKIYTYLKQTDDSFSWYLDHESDAILLTQIGDYLSDKDAVNYSTNHNTINQLPIIYANYDSDYNYTEFRIDGGKFPNCSSDFCIKITDVTGGNLEFAKKLLQEKGINVENDLILYEYTPIQEL